MESKFPPIKGRIYNYLKDNKISISSFIRKIQISETSFRGASAKSEFGGDILSRIVEEYVDISPLWLLTGKESSEDIYTNSATGLVKGNNNIVASSGAQVHRANNEYAIPASVDNLINILTAQLAEKDRQLAEKDRQLAEKDKQIELILRAKG